VTKSPQPIDAAATKINSGYGYRPCVHLQSVEDLGVSSQAFRKSTIRPATSSGCSK
jgi:hypothetical protein